jgi:hypothetical protein
MAVARAKGKLRGKQPTLSGKQQKGAVLYATAGGDSPSAISPRSDEPNFMV